MIAITVTSARDTPELDRRLSLHLWFWLSIPMRWYTTNTVLIPVIAPSSIWKTRLHLLKEKEKWVSLGRATLHSLTAFMVLFHRHRWIREVECDGQMLFSAHACEPKQHVLALFASSEVAHLCHKTEIFYRVSENSETHLMLAKPKLMSLYWSFIWLNQKIFTLHRHKTGKTSKLLHFIT